MGPCGLAESFPGPSQGLPPVVWYLRAIRAGAQCSECEVLIREVVGVWT